MKYLIAATLVLFFAANGLSKSKLAQTGTGLNAMPTTELPPSTKPGDMPRKHNVDLIDTPSDATTTKTLNQDGVEVDPMSGLPVEQKNFKSPSAKSKYEKDRMEKMRQRERHERSKPNPNPLNNQNPNTDLPRGGDY